jgi:hypothetical protein
MKRLHYIAALVGPVSLVLAAANVRAAGQEADALPTAGNRLEGAKDEAPNELTRDEKALINDVAEADEAAAKAVFEDKFDAYKSALREIEKLNAQYQASDEATRKKLNNTLSGQIAHAQSLVNEMVEAAVAAYVTAPNADPKIADLLVAVVKYNTIGRQVGPGVPSSDDPRDVYYPIDGGDQYERALPIIKVLIEGGHDDKQLYVWGFL